MRGAEDDAAGGDLRQVGQRPLANEECINRIVGKVRMGVEDAGKMRLRVEVDTKRPLAPLRDAGEQVQGRRCLADATLLVEYRDDRHDDPLI